MIEGEDPRSREGAGGGGGGGGEACSAVAPWTGNIAAENAYQGFHGGMTSGPVVSVNNEQLVSATLRFGISYICTSLTFC